MANGDESKIDPGAEVVGPFWLIINRPHGGTNKIDGQCVVMAVPASAACQGRQLAPRVAFDSPGESATIGGGRGDDTAAPSGEESGQPAQKLVQPLAQP